MATLQPDYFYFITADGRLHYQQLFKVSAVSVEVDRPMTINNTYLETYEDNSVLCDFGDPEIEIFSVHVLSCFTLALDSQNQVYKTTRSCTKFKRLTHLPPIVKIITHNDQYFLITISGRIYYDNYSNSTGDTIAYRFSGLCRKLVHYDQSSMRRLPVTKCKKKFPGAISISKMFRNYGGIFTLTADGKVSYYRKSSSPEDEEGFPKIKNQWHTVRENIMTWKIEESNLLLISYDHRVEIFDLVNTTLTEMFDRICRYDANIPEFSITYINLPRYHLDEEMKLWSIHDGVIESINHSLEIHSLISLRSLYILLLVSGEIVVMNSHGYLMEMYLSRAVQLSNTSERRFLGSGKRCIA